MRAKVLYWLAPGLQSVELTAADYVAQRFSSHWHSGFAIGAVTRNAQSFHADGSDWVVAAGDLIILNPGQIHDGYSLSPAGWSSRMAYVPASALAALAGATDYQLETSLRFTQAVVRAPELSESFLHWHALSESVEDVRSHPLTAQVFAGLLRFMRAGPPLVVSKTGRAVAAKLHERLLDVAVHGDAKVASLSLDLELTRYGSWRRVKNQFGIAPKQLLSHLRLMSAKQLLASGYPVVEAALDCGYHDQSHFSRRFAAAYGFTPAQFRSAQLLRTD